ncbi:RDD family protein [Actinocorallia populi]|uniref:RDD family protein n=1 Tax=Actinocorallia populi TaxID=2079200 RepID=UPI000D0967F1|nr:RDD family protein [Actinocorallia populi]
MSGNENKARWTGTWLSGARAAGADLGYPGEQLGLPRTGRGSAGSYARRLVALLVDWFLCTLISGGLANAFDWSDQAKNLTTLLIFGLQAWVLVGFTGTTLGKAVAGLHVVRLDGRPVGPVWSLARMVLLLLVVPALLWDRDHRGLHDRAADTIVIESR